MFETLEEINDRMRSDLNVIEIKNKLYSFLSRWIDAGKFSAIESILIKGIFEEGLNAIPLRRKYYLVEGKENV